MGEFELLTYPRPPWNHQREGIEKALGTRDFAFFFEPGCGKTSTTIHTLRHQYRRNKRVLRTLVLCPVVVCEQWKRDFEKDSKIGPQVHVLKGSQGRRLQVLEKYRADPAVFITNYEALLMRELLQQLLIWKPEIVVFDESQRLKNHQAARTKMAMHLADGARHRYILSGTPVLNSPLDIWAQYRVLDKGESFTDSLGKPLNFYAFRSRYFYDKNAGMPSQRHFPKWTEQQGTAEIFQQIIYKKAMRVLKRDCLDLPDLVRIEVPVELSPEQKRVYHEMRTDFIAFLDSGEAVTAQIAITKALRLQQIVSGYAKTEDGQSIVIKDCPRLVALQELLEDIPETEKVIIWAVFQDNYEQIEAVLESMGLAYTELTGRVSGNDRQANIDRFQTDPKCRVMIANQGAGGIGVNLTAASYSIFYSRNFSLEQDLQAEARNHRGGSEIHAKITRYDLVAMGTIDEIVLEALASKLSMAEQILSLRKKL